jgi:hypothetical protein
MFMNYSVLPHINTGVSQTGNNLKRHNFFFFFFFFLLQLPGRLIKQQIESVEEVHS